MVCGVLGTGLCCAVLSVLLRRDVLCHLMLCGVVLLSFYAVLSVCCVLLCCAVAVLYVL